MTFDEQRIELLKIHDGDLEAARKSFEWVTGLLVDAGAPVNETISRRRVQGAFRQAIREARAFGLTGAELVDLVNDYDARAAAIAPRAASDFSGVAQSGSARGS